MNRATTSAVLIVFACLTACSDHQVSSGAIPSNRAVIVAGQLLLPGGAKARGAEVIVESEPENGDPVRTWLHLGAEGRFSQALEQTPIRVTVEVGGVEMYRAEPGRSAKEPSAEGPFDLGVIDLRRQLVAHRMKVLTAPRSAQGDARMAIFNGPPPVGPFGGTVSLGSSQFPTFVFGSELEWLVARTASNIHFLVERPAGNERGKKWRSGKQQLFGPFNADGLPAQVVVN